MKSQNMASNRVRMVLEVDGEVVTERSVEVSLSKINEIKQRWYHTYAIKSRKLAFEIYVEIPSAMENVKCKRKPFITNTINYEQVETIAECI